MPYSFEEINELSKSGNIKQISEKKSDDVGFFESALAGVATGALNIPKGFISLGAQVYDLIGDTNTSKEVEVLKREVDSKIQKAIDNPLANK